MKSIKNIKKMSFEEGLKHLEDLVGSLEGRELTLDEALKSFEEGVRLSEHLAAKLEEAEAKVALLTKNQEGRLETAGFLRLDEELPDDDADEDYDHEDDDEDGDSGGDEDEEEDDQGDEE